MVAIGRAGCGGRRRELRGTDREAKNKRGPFCFGLANFTIWHYKKDNAIRCHLEWQMKHILLPQLPGQLRGSAALAHLEVKLCRWLFWPCVVARPGRLGPGRSGPARCGSRCAYVRSGSVRSGSVRFGPTRSGSVQLGPVRLGPVRSVRFGPVQLGSAWSGPVRSGPVYCYPVRSGSAAPQLQNKIHL